MITAAMAVTDAFRMQLEARRLNVAVLLARSKMTQLLTVKNLDPGVTKGNFGESGQYAGYSYEVNVRKEQIDLAKVATTGRLGSAPVKDKLPPSIRNTSEQKQKELETQTGGIVNIIKINVTIRYDRGDSTGEYTVETFRSDDSRFTQ